MPRLKHVDLPTFCKKRAINTRSAWLTKAKKMGIDVNEVPTRKDIQEMLELESFDGMIIEYNDYLCNTRIPYSTIELDHKTPISRGGSFSLSNVGITSRYYNNAKGDMTEEEFRSLLALVKSWGAERGRSFLLRLIKSNKVYRKR